MRKREPITAVELQKHYAFLKELYSLLKSGEDFTFRELCAAHDISRRASSILNKGGVIKKKGHGRSTTYTWTSIEPTPSMARELILKVKDINKQKHDEWLQRKKGKKVDPMQIETDFESVKPPQIADKQERTKEKYTKMAEDALNIPEEKQPSPELKPEPETVTTVETSVLWGLFTFKKTTK